MLDVTYYLRETIDEMTHKSGHTVHYAAASFHTVPGEYRLPWESGTLTVENRLKTDVAFLS